MERQSRRYEDNIPRIETKTRRRSYHIHENGPTMTINRQNHDTSLSSMGKYYEPLLAVSPFLTSHRAKFAGFACVDGTLLVMVGNGSGFGYTPYIHGPNSRYTCFEVSNIPTQCDSRCFTPFAHDYTQFRADSHY